MSSGRSSAAPGGELRLPEPGARIHLVGVAGAGMRGLALLLAEGGYRLSGCDREAPEVPELAGRGVVVERGHDPSHIEGVELVVCSAAVPEDSEELLAARAAGVRVLKRARAMGALLQARRVVGVAGTHGKTTITAMAGLACQAAGLDPTVLVGGRVAEWGAFARQGGGDVAVVEADEFDRSFLELYPFLALVSSAEPEHLESYGSWEAVRDAYGEFAARAAARGGVLYCADDPGAREIGVPLGGSGYGFSPGAEYGIESVESGTEGQRFRVRSPRGLLDLRLRVPGEHNVRNATAALALALELGGDPAPIVESLASFTGVERRLQTLAESGNIVVVDDYAHHPTEVEASLGALRSRHPEARLVAVFQPHLFSRTRRFAARFAAALGEADEALVLPIYPAREAPLPGVTSALIAAEEATVRQTTRAEVMEAVRAVARGEPRVAGSRWVFAFMGAGDVTRVARQAAEEVTGRAVEA